MSASSPRFASDREWTATVACRPFPSGIASSLAIMLAFVIVLLCGLPLSAAEDRFTFWYENVLGTSLEIQVQTTELAAAESVEQQVLVEIDRLNAVFSSYTEDSEFSRWQTTRNRAVPVSPELFELLTACNTWQQRSAGVFQPGVQSLTDLWQSAARRGTLPTADELSSTVQRVQAVHWKLDAEHKTAERLGDVPLSLNAIAKGAILEAACRSAWQQRTATVRGISVMIGGDVCVLGDLSRDVAIADPQRDAENALPLTTVRLTNRCLATSGGYRRGVQIGDQWYSHLLDPRTGMPVKHVTTASVIAPRAADADALATIFCILLPSESAALAETLPDVDYFLLTSSGERHSSRGWQKLERQLVEPVTVAVVQAADPVLGELTVDFELSTPEGGRYRRPYVAIWLENADEFPVRTALLWMQTMQPGPRWHRELLRWYRHDAVRRLHDKRDLIGTISGATRGPGKYKAVFDGKNDAGQPLPPGEYTLFIEVTREHGTYQLIRKRLTLGSEPIAKMNLPGNVEVKSAAYEYRFPQPAR